jgi:RHS repeat-associated protein
MTAQEARTAGRRGLAALLIAAIASAGCPAGQPLAPQGGLLEYQRHGLVPVPGGLVNAAGGNLIVRRRDLSLDTPLGTWTIGAIYNSTTRAWQWRHRVRYDGTTFVDQSGASFDVSALADGDPIPGTHWVRTGEDSIRTRGGLAYHFAPDGALDHVRWSSLEHPRLRFAPGGISLCTSSVVCTPLFEITSGPGGEPTRIADVRTGRSVSFAYGADGRLALASEPVSGGSGEDGTRYEYSVGGLLSAIVTPEGERIEYAYQIGGRIRSVRQVGAGDPTHRFWFQVKDPNGLYSTVHTNPLGGQTRYLFDAERRLHWMERLATGDAEWLAWVGLRPSRHTDAAGAASEFVHDGDRLVTWVQPSGNVVHYTHAPDALDLEDPTRSALARIEDSLGLVEERSFDAEGRVLDQRNGELESTLREYQGAQVVRVSRMGLTLDFPVSGSHGHWLVAEMDGEVVEKRAFDAAGNAVVSGIRPGVGGYLTRAFDARRHLSGIQLAATDDQGHVTEIESLGMERRSDGRIARILRPGGGDHEFVHDALGRVVLLRERVDGVWSETRVEYDLAGHTTARERANGMREEFDYDVYGRMTAHRILRDGALEGEATFTWDRGRLVARSDSIRGTTELYGYDAAGRLATTLFGYGESLTREYDLRGRLVAEVWTLPGSGVVADVGYVYDLADRRIAMLDRATGVALVADSIEDGRLRSRSFGNGLVRTRTYDARGRPVAFETRDAEGEILESTSIVRSAQQGPPREETVSITETSLAVSEERVWMPLLASLVDPDGLVGKRVLGWTAAGGGAKTYAWTALSNPADDASGNTFTYNQEGNRLLAATLAHEGESVSYTWDAAGFATSRGGVPIEWSAAGRMAAFGAARLEWDMSGRLVSLSTGGATRRFLLFGGRVESDLASLGTLDLGPVSIHLGSGVRSYRHHDARGHVRFVSDEQGSVLVQYRYTPYGVDAVWGSVANERSFERRQPLGPLFLMGARAYDPLVGRFLSPDPVVQLVNQYAYTLGNPIHYQDREGAEWSTRTALAVGLGTVAVIGAGLAGGALLPGLGVGAVFLQAGVASAAITVASGTLALAIDDVLAPASRPPPPPPPPPTPPAPIPAPPSGGSQLKVLEIGIQAPVSTACSPLAMASVPNGRPALPLVLVLNALAGAAWWRRRRQLMGAQ